MRQFVLNYLIVFGVIALSITSTVFSDTTLIFEEGYLGYTGNDAISINPSAPDTSSEGSLDLLWDGNSLSADPATADDVTYLLMRYDNIIGSLQGQIPAGSSIKSAMLRYSLTNGGDVAYLHELLVPFEIGSWNTQPWIDTTTPALVAGTHYVPDAVSETPGDPNNSNIEVDVTSSVQKWINNELENNGWVFLPTASNGVEFMSHEAEAQHRPRLVVETPIGNYSFEDGVNGYQGCVDTWTEIVIPLRDVGRDARVLADGNENDPSWAFTRFDDIIGNGPGQIPPGTQITNAYMEISIFNAGNWITVHEMKAGIDFNEYSISEAAELGVLPTNVTTMGNPRTVPGTGQETLPDVDFDADPELSQQIIANYYDENAFLDIELRFPTVEEEIIPSPFDETNPPWMFEMEALDTIEQGAEGNVRVNVTSSVQNYSDGAENRGWFFFHEGAFGGPGDGVEWRSSEWSQPEIPTLTVNTPLGEFVFKQGLNGYTGTVDTYIHSAFRDDAFGEELTIFTDGDEEGAQVTGLIKFENIIGNDAGQIPPGTQIDNAQLTLVTTEQGGSTRLHDINPGYPFDNNTTFNTFGGDPVFDRGTVVAQDALAVNPDAGSGVIMLMDVTSSIQRYSNGEENTGWALIPLVPFYDPGAATGGLGKADDALGYVASESADTISQAGRPRLTVVIEGPTAVNDFMLY
jgi:hypothetical protein